MCGALRIMLVYFHFVALLIKKHNYKPKLLAVQLQDHRLAMGAPPLAILREIFIEHFKHTSIINILKKKS